MERKNTNICQFISKRKDCHASVEGVTNGLVRRGGGGGGGFVGGWGVVGK